MEEHYRSIAESIIQRSTPKIDLEVQTKIDNFERGMDAFSLYNSVYLEIIAYEEGLNQTPKKSVKQRICAINNKDINQQFMF